MVKTSAVLPDHNLTTCLSHITSLVTCNNNSSKYKSSTLHRNTNNVISYVMLLMMSDNQSAQMHDHTTHLYKTLITPMIPSLFHMIRDHKDDSQRWSCPSKSALTVQCKKEECCRWTLVVVSSLTPFTTIAILVHVLGSTPLESVIV